MPTLCPLTREFLVAHRFQYKKADHTSGARESYFTRSIFTVVPKNSILAVRAIATIDPSRTCRWLFPGHILMKQQGHRRRLYHHPVN